MRAGIASPALREQGLQDPPGKRPGRQGEIQEKGVFADQHRGRQHIGRWSVRICACIIPAATFLVSVLISLRGRDYHECHMNIWLAEIDRSHVITYLMAALTAR